MVFYYRARHADGLRVSGSIGAETRDAAMSHLRARGLFVTLLETAHTARGALAGIATILTRSAASRSAFFRSFATLVGVGISIKRALDTLVAESRDPAFTEALRSICADVESGTALSTAMERHAGEFSPVVIAMVSAGEAAGNLAGALQSIADLEERNRTLRKRVFSALSYPAVVAVAAAGLVLFLIADTMPAFAGMFEQMQVAVPPVTRLLIGAGTALHSPRLWSIGLLFVTASGIALWRYVRSSHAWALTLDRATLRIPLVGDLLRKTLVVRFSRTLGSLLSAGVDVVASLEASTHVGGRTFRDALKGAVESLRAGNPFASPLEASGLFDATFLLLVRVGEESGTLDAMLLRVASYYEIDVETGLATLTGIVEPALICLLGAAIGTIVSSIIVPLYSMIGSIK
ncbi:MAG TPA: type II secretion system F family protein [Candidatus Baltobacteraceae bacterium]|nr:type II secretion system F family protein [Candidatus Baltobacteraceae bacterium]